MQVGGPSYSVELGRLDGLTSTSTSVDGKLPKPTFNLNQLTSMFASNGLSQADMVALSGKTMCYFLVNGTHHTLKPKTYASDSHLLTSIANSHPHAFKLPSSISLF